MIAISTEMIFNAACFCILCGACLGAMYAAFSFLPILFLSCIPKFKNKYNIPQSYGLGFARHVLDYLFALAAGIIYLVIQYVFIDGANVLLPAFLLFLSITVTKGIVESFFAKILNRKR